VDVASPSASEPEEVAPRGSRRRRLTAALRLHWVLSSVAALGVVALLVGALASWHFSSVLLVPNHEGWYRVKVDSVAPHRIVFERSEETERPGVYGLVWRGGHATVGKLLSADGDTVTRRLGDVDGYIVPGVEAWYDTDVYPGTPRSALGLPFTTVPIHSELGAMPAWIIPPKKGQARPHRPTTGNIAAAGDTWAIVVHGINGDLQEGLRLVPTLRRAGLTSMLISYRDDDGAPKSPDGLHHLGMTEWKDLEAAARYALAHGARHLVLAGYSMGGAIVARFMELSPLAGRVSALLLDAPALDWRRILEYHATEMGLPAVSVNPVEWAVGARIDVDWDGLDALEHAEDFQLPILIFHGDDDKQVPLSLSEDFADELPRWATLYAVPQAGHTQSWNVDPRKYESRVEGFLDAALK
jgi:fermentation-respiration switch protein FrsA (DUF1100 family)